VVVAQDLTCRAGAFATQVGVSLLECPPQAFELGRAPLLIASAGLEQRLTITLRPY